MIDQTPTIRVRVNHSRTIKNGWGHETTVEMTTPMDRVFDAELFYGSMSYHLSRADELARAETNRRNILDGEGATQ